MSNRNGAVRFFGGGINSAAYWVGTTLLSASHVLNDSSVTGTTVKDALNYLSTASTAVFPFVGAGLAEQDLVSYDASAATWRNRTVAASLKGAGTNSVLVGTSSVAPGTSDIILGPSAGATANTGSNNIGIGADTLDGATVALSNVIAIGAEALSGALTAAANGSIGLGYRALTGATTGVNTAIGYHSQRAITVGTANTTLGNAALGHASTANNVSSVVAIGDNALSAALTGGANATVAVGTSALSALTSGAKTAAVGFFAGLGLSTGSNNTFMGYAVAASSNGSNNVAIGTETECGTSASDNTIVGYGAGNGTIGSRNTATGSLAFNSASGAVTDCVAVGYAALTGILTAAASGCTAVGVQALLANTTGVNTAVGYQSFPTNSTGTYNTGVGYQTGYSVSTATHTTAVGYQAGSSLQTGLYNTFLGAFARADTTTRSGCVVLGVNAIPTADDQFVIRMGNTSTKELIITPVVDGTVRAESTYIPFKVGSTQYYIKLYT